MAPPPADRPATSNRPFPAGKSPARLLSAVTAVLLAAAGLYVLARRIPWDKQPADFRIDGRSLVITTKGGRELWRYDSRQPGLEGEDRYRRRFQNKATLNEPSGDRRVLPWLIIRDLDRDGKNEVLFVPVGEDGRDPGRLVFLEHDGRPVWEFEADPESPGGKAGPADSRTLGVGVADFYKDAKPEVIFISAAAPGSPARAVVLDLGMNVLGEYWNAGPLGDYQVVDLNRDEVPELLLAGRNDDYGRPCLIALDLRRMRGASPASGDSLVAGKEPGTELFYVLFPLSAYDELFRPEARADRVNLLAGERLDIVASPSGILFELDFEFNFLTVVLSHGFERRHEDEFRAGRLRERYDEPRIWRDLAAGLGWYDRRAGAWSKTRTMSNPWPAGK
jgi:hypothetical protein